VVHRDLKPENILLSKYKHVKVIDFGDSKYLDEEKNAQFRIDQDDDRQSAKTLRDDECDFVDVGSFDSEEGDKLEMNNTYSPSAEPRAEAKVESNQPDDKGEELPNLRVFKSPTGTSYEIEEESKDKILDSPLPPRRGTFVGTAYYVSPEMLESNHAGPEADYWALGCIIFKLLFGMVPFDG